jgi:hypothetical protein
MRTSRNFDGLGTFAKERDNMIIYQKSVNQDMGEKMSFSERKRQAQYSPVCGHCGSNRDLSIVHIDDVHFAFMCATAQAIYNVQKLMPLPKRKTPAGEKREFADRSF